MLFRFIPYDYTYDENVNEISLIMFRSLWVRARAGIRI